MTDDAFDDDDFDDFCIDCGDDFRYDDCGGYNPPCECGYHCRSCHEADEVRKDGYEGDGDDYYDDDEDAA